MSKQTAANFFIRSLSEVDSAGLYQALLRDLESYQQFGSRLIRLAEQAHAFRQFDKVKEAGVLLSNIPLKNHQAIGHYFLALATHRVASGDTGVAKRLFELTVDTAPDAYKLKASLALGSIALRRKDFDSAARHFQETSRVGSLSVAGLQAIRGLSILKSLEGHHTQAISDLESILPVIKYAPAHVYFDILNSYAVELTEVGRKQEARNIMRAVLASPFAFAYPEWRGTAEDLRLSSRSMVAIDSFPYNVLTLPGREPYEQPAVRPMPARVFSFAKWKKKMAEREKNRAKMERGRQKELANMSAQDMGFELLEIIADNRPDYAQMRIILDYVKRILAAPDTPSA